MRALNSPGVVQAVRYLDDATRQDAILTLIGNLDILYPIFPVVAFAIKSCFDSLQVSTQEEICTTLRERVLAGSFLVSTELHAAYAVRILGELKRPENVDAIVHLHKKFPNPIVRRDVLLAMARWGEFAWLSDQMNDYQGMSPWERRAFIVASYTLRDAGKKWRERTKKRFNPLESIVRDWASERFGQKDWTIPL